MDKDNKLKELIRALAAEYLQRESNHTSMITVTNVSVSDRGSRATIFFTVLPEDKEEGAIGLAKRKRPEFRDFFAKKARMRALPFFDFAIDKGEKNRQQIDEISRNI